VLVVSCGCDVGSVPVASRGNGGGEVGELAFKEGRLAVGASMFDGVAILVGYVSLSCIVSSGKSGLYFAVPKSEHLVQWHNHLHMHRDLQ